MGHSSTGDRTYESSRLIRDSSGHFYRYSGGHIYGFRTSECKSSSCFEKHPNGTYVHPLTTPKTHHIDSIPSEWFKGLFTAADNLETPYASEALAHLIKLIAEDAIESIEPFFCAIEEAVTAARARNRYHEGVRSLRALSIRDVRREVIFEDPQTKTQARLIELQCTRNKILHELRVLHL